MRVTEQTIEADVVEIDGVPMEPKVSREDGSRASTWDNWQSWGGKVKTLDRRWWPLWLLLGFVALVLLVAVGMVVAVFAVFYLIAKGLLASFASLFESSYELQRK